MRSGAVDEDTVPGLAQSVLWGLARSARAEHPELGLTLLDLDDSDPADALLSAATHAEEPELASRAGTLLAPRLVRARDRDATGTPVVPDLAGRPALVPTDGTVLITGGLGAVGRHIAGCSPNTAFRAYF
ncbi:hypothetical protein O1M63_52190 [Streptomyces mirabilis]|nr:hypothetical protein [Streptomyces mirabilis]